MVPCHSGRACERYQVIGRDYQAKPWIGLIAITPTSGRALDSAGQDTTARPPRLTPSHTPFAAAAACGGNKKDQTPPVGIPTRRVPLPLIPIDFLRRARGDARRASVTTRLRAFWLCRRLKGALAVDHRSGASATASRR